MKKIFLILIASFCTNNFLFAQTYTGLFYSPNSMGMHADSYFNLVPNSGVIATNSWNILHQDNSSLFQVAFASSQPYIQVGQGRQTNFFVSGNVGIGTTSPGLTTHILGALGFPASTGASQIGVLRLQGVGSNGVLDFSVNAGSGASLQVTNQTDLSQKYPLLLNPNGGNVGIGTATPSTKLHVNGALRIEPAAGGVVGSATGSRIELSSGGTTSIEENWGINLIGNDASPVKIRNASLLVGYTSSSAGWGTGGNLLVQGNVGIGTTSPSQKLDISGDAKIASRLYFGTANAYNGSSYGVIGLQTGVAGKNIVFYNYDGPVNELMTLNGTTGTAAINNGGLTVSGNVGIGTTTPDAKLAVSGQVHAQEVKVSVAVPGPDYVFDKDYKLSSLEEIKNYIDQNKHLPEVPSAKEMEKNGVQLGEMNMLLLKKIEELTLYVIELKNEVQKLKENQEPKK